MRASILLGRETVGFIVAIGVAVGCRIVVSPLDVAASVEFKDVSEFQAFAVAQGLHCHNGSLARPHFHRYFFVADHAIATADLEKVHTIYDCGLTPAWRGLLWVKQVQFPEGEFDPEQMNGTWRLWGNVVVAGDEALMDRIEEMFRTRQVGK